eukprot:GILJ01003943.1.p1 GENE.GILJ01003943.1~~GILJ01003943.1.p1  ORF type:complete len:432 (+),score=52.91 GILJ01003943.1:178-1473(+)
MISNGFVSEFSADPDAFNNMIPISWSLGFDSLSSPSTKLDASVVVGGTPPKSRVETRISMFVRLINNRSGELNTSYKRMILPAAYLDKQWSGRAAEIPSDDQSVRLELRVLCANRRFDTVRRCIPCTRREAKASLRKSGRNVNLSDEELLATVPDVEFERDQIVRVFGTPTIDFSGGNAVILMRFTCYCRHHAESQGFVIESKLFDARTNEYLGVGVTEPIMITDDHKAAKKRSLAASQALKSAKRPRVELSPNFLMPPSPGLWSSEDESLGSCTSSPARSVSPNGSSPRPCDILESLSLPLPHQIEYSIDCPSDYNPSNMFSVDDTVSSVNDTTCITINLPPPSLELRRDNSSEFTPSHWCMVKAPPAPSVSTDELLTGRQQYSSGISFHHSNSITELVDDSIDDFNFFDVFSPFETVMPPASRLEIPWR